MSPRRTLSDVRQSRDAHREELESALAALKASTKRAGDGASYVEQYTEQARAKVLGPIENDDGELAVGALAVGFLLGGGVSGTLRLPFKLVRGLGSVVSATRRLVLLGSAAGAVLIATADEETRQSFELQAKAVLETVRDELGARLDQVGN